MPTSPCWLGANARSSFCICFSRTFQHCVHLVFEAAQRHIWCDRSTQHMSSRGRELKKTSACIQNAVKIFNFLLLCLNLNIFLVGYSVTHWHKETHVLLCSAPMGLYFVEPLFASIRAECLFKLKTYIIPYFLHESSSSFTLHMQWSLKYFYLCLDLDFDWLRDSKTWLFFYLCCSACMFRFVHCRSIPVSSLLWPIICCLPGLSFI